jgi:predicted RNA-binding protein with PUA-like domain
MAVGDQAYFYHSGKGASVVGIVEVIRAHFADPSDDSGRFVAVKVRALSALPNAVSLKRIKSEPALADCPLVRQSRLSVMPLTQHHWDAIARMAQTPVS